ncbi:EAL domain-containing protein [Desulfosarcina sp.]|uniref:sensor domain-containing protein n=1 Tax=Desulfosarcina sp. TaxID=2027861 RepID=UPI003970637E
MTGQSRTESGTAVRDAKAAQDRYRILFERSPDAVIVSAPDGLILDLNPAAVTFLGVDPTGLVELNITSFYAHTADQARLISKVEETGLVQNTPVIFVDSRGQLKHCLVTLMRLDKPDGGTYGYQSVIQDVTKRRQAERKLLGQKNYADQLIDIAPEAIAILDMEDRVIRVNEEFCHLFQYTRHACVGQRMDELIVPQHLKAESLSLSARAIGGACFEVETRRMKKDGTLVDVSILAKPIATEKDQPAIYVIYRDISERKRAQEALTKSEQRHRTVLEAAPDPVMVRDMAERIIYLNPAFTTVFGWTLDECHNRVIDFIPEANLLETQEFMAKIKLGDAFSGVETQRLTKAGQLVDVSISGAVFFDTDGNPEGYVITLQDVSERRKKDAELRYVAYHDVLTGLPNRKSFYMCLDDMLQHSSRRDSDRAWALMFLDLDKFKQVNDALGHDTGDRLLKGVANRLKASLRETDHLFRLGGDEFTVILTNLNRDIDVARVARKILESLVQPFRFNGHEIFTSTSIGISVFPNDGWDVEGLVKNADMAMYTAKESGGGDFRFFTEEMNRKALYRMKMESSLRKALDQNELVLYYQPLVSRNNRIEGMEALLRWHHPDLGLILPADFIRITEETGIIVPVGRWVLQTACAQAKRWHDMGFPDLFVAVNLSARQFQEPDFEQMVVDIITASGLPPESLKLEVTESSVIQNPEVCIAKMNALRAKGITFSIDDFGTGYSSLSYLKRFPIDALKIDRSFISDAMKSKADQEIVKTIIAMARNLNIDAVAEGVETQEQKDFLASHGCDSMQGFLFAHPVPVDKFKDLLEHQRKTSDPTDPKT